jgi:hypothetical protein
MSTVQGVVTDVYWLIRRLLGRRDTDVRGLWTLE